MQTTECMTGSKPLRMHVRSAKSSLVARPSSATGGAGDPRQSFPAGRHHRRIHGRRTVQDSAQALPDRCGRQARSWCRSRTTDLGRDRRKIHGEIQVFLGHKCRGYTARQDAPKVNAGQHSTSMLFNTSRAVVPSGEFPPSDVTRPLTP